METTAHKIFSSIFKEIVINAEDFNKYKQDYSVDSSVMLNLILDKIYKLDPNGESMEYVYNAVSDIREQDGNADKSYKALENSLTFYLTAAIPFIYNGEYKEYDKASDYPETLRIDEYENEFVKQCTLFLIALKIVSQKDNPRIINLIKPNEKTITKPHPLELALLAADTAKNISNAPDNAAEYKLIMQGYVYAYELQENWTELEQLNLLDSEAMEILKLLVSVLAELKNKIEAKNLSQVATGKKVLNIIIKKLGTTNFESETKEYLKGKFLS